MFGQIPKLSQKTEYERHLAAKQKLSEKTNNIATITTETTPKLQMKTSKQKSAQNNTPEMKYHQHIIEPYALP